MKTKIFVVLSFIIMISGFVFSQENKSEPKYGISFSGFVKTDIFYDSRQTVNIREGHFLLYPANVSLDNNLQDVNSNPTFNMLSIQSRLKGTISAPDAFGAKTSGVIEADFFGNENASFGDINGFRLRHAFVKMSWPKTELLVGQFFHPMFITECYPEVISFNTGVPFQPFSRNPQIRLSYKTGGIKFIATAFTQRDFTGMGPDYSFKNNLYEVVTISSSKFLQNAGIPDCNLQLQFTPDSIQHVFGISVDYKCILPELYTVNNARNFKFASSVKVNSFSGLVYAKIQFKPIVVKAEVVLAQNATDLLMIGGYAVTQITDTATGTKEFTNINTGSAWIEINTTGKSFQFGLFAGFTKNLGSMDNINTGTFYSRGSNIDQVYRVAPRLVFISGKLNVALEGEYTAATYGTANSDNKGRVTEGLNTVVNIRGLLAVIYKF